MHKGCAKGFGHMVRDMPRDSGIYAQEYAEGDAHMLRDMLRVWTYDKGDAKGFGHICQGIWAYAKGYAKGFGHMLKDMLRGLGIC